MLNILADALLIASRLGRLPEDDLPRHPSRRNPRDERNTEGLRVGDTLRNQIR
jgi:hypothetical protein